MRISSTGKKMIFSHLLGLFLTTATPLSFSPLFNTYAIAADSEEVEAVNPLHKEIRNLVKDATDGTESAPLEIALNEKGKKSQYNLGHALHDLRQKFEERKEPNVLNQFLEKLVKVDFNLQDNIAIDAATKIYNMFHYTAMGLANNTHQVEETTITDLYLNLEVVTRLYNVMAVSFTYQNLSQQRLNKNRQVEEEKTAELKKEYDGSKEKIDQEEQELTKKFNEVKQDLEEQIKRNKESKKSAEDAENKDIHSIQTFGKTIETLTKKLGSTENTYNTSKLQSELTLKELAKKHELIMEELKLKHAEEEKAVFTDLSYIFEELGSSLGFKSVTRFFSGKSLTRKKFNYAQFDKLIEEDDSALVDAQYLLYSKILKAHAVSKNPKTKYTSGDILEALLAYLNISSEDQETFNQWIQESSVNEQALSVPEETQLSHSSSYTEVPEDTNTSALSLLTKEKKEEVTTPITSSPQIEEEKEAVSPRTQKLSQAIAKNTVAVLTSSVQNKKAGTSKPLSGSQKRKLKRQQDKNTAVPEEQKKN